MPDYLERADRFAREEAPQISAMLVARHGYIVFERYYADYEPGSYFHVASVTKSVTSALIGIAFRDGLLESVDQPLADFFTEADRRLRLRHLLTLTAGWPYRETHLWSVSDIVRDPLVREPDSQFEYDDNAPHLLSAVLNQIAGMGAAAFAQRKLFEPLGMWRDAKRWRDTAGTVVRRRGEPTTHACAGEAAEKTPWLTSPEGISRGGFGLHLTLRDMARFGLLYASDGFWEGRQILPEDYVTESTTPRSSGGSPVWMPYGYLWWLPVWHRGHACMAAGWGGQEIYVNQDLDLVVAIACTLRPDRPPHNQNVVNRYLLPAVRDWTSLPMSILSEAKNLPV